MLLTVEEASSGLSAYVYITTSFGIPTTAHATFQDPETGTVWRVLQPDDGNGHALIITEYVHVLNTSYHSA